MVRRTMQHSTPWKFTVTTLLFTCWAGGCERKPANEPNFVGHVAPLSGAERDRGMQAVHGIQIAIDELNADSSQWIAGRRVAVIHADSEGDLDVLASQAVRLVSINKVGALLGGLTRAQTNRLAPISQEYSVNLVAASGTIGEPAVSTAFAVGLSLTERARLAALAIAEHFKSDRVQFIIDGRDPGMISLVDHLHRKLEDKKVASERFTFGDSAQLVEFAKGQISGSLIVFAGSARELILARAAMSADIAKRPLLFVGDESETVGLPGQPATRNECYWLGSVAPDFETPAFVKFRDKFVSKFGATPDVDAILSYTSAQVLFAAARDAGGVVSSRLQPKLRDLKNLAGLMGPLSMASAHSIRGPAFLLQGVNGAAVSKAKYDAEPPPTQDKAKHG